MLSRFEQFLNSFSNDSDGTGTEPELHGVPVTKQVKWVKVRICGVLVCEVDQNDPAHVRIRKRVNGQKPQSFEINLRDYLENNKNVVS